MKSAKLRGAKRDYDAAFCNKKPNSKFLAAVRALQSHGDADYAIGYFLAQQRDKRLADEGYVISGSIRRLVGKRRAAGSNDPNAMPNEPPGDDHGGLYLKDGKPAFYLSEPYKLTYGKMKEIVAFCERWGLLASVDARQSSWFPGETIAIKYEVKGKGG